MKNFAWFLLIILFNSCKIGNVEQKHFNLSQIYQRAYSSNIIDKNPLILIDNNSIGLISEIDTSSIKYKNINRRDIVLIPKEQTGLVDYFGNNSIKGIISIKHSIPNGLNFNRPLIFILNNKKFTLDELTKDKKHKIFLIGYFEGIKDNQNNHLDIYILSNNRKNVDEILKIFK